MNAELFRRLLEKEFAGERWVREIRIRVGKPVRILDKDGEKLLYFEKAGGEVRFLWKDIEKTATGQNNGDVIRADRSLINGIVEIFSRHSLYAYERELGQGFLTIRGGHRVGISGKAVTEGGQIRTIRDISSLNLRIAHEVRGCASKLLPYLVCDGEFFDTLLIAPPGAGKTTLLRDLIRQLSDGGSWGDGKNVSVVDERSEIAACFEGIPQCDLGMRTDVMDGCPKAEGMLMMLRSMAPQILAVDEVGDEEELMAMRYGMNCGCRLLATVHGADVRELMKRPAWKEILKEKLFSRYVVLSGVPAPGTIREIFDEELRPMEKWRKTV